MATPAEQAVIEAALDHLTDCRNKLANGLHGGDTPTSWAIRSIQLDGYNLAISDLGRWQRHESLRRITEIGEESGGYD